MAGTTEMNNVEKVLQAKGMYLQAQEHSDIMLDMLYVALMIDNQFSENLERIIQEYTTATANLKEYLEQVYEKSGEAL